MNWKRLYIIAALLIIALDFSRLGDGFPSSIFRIDHSFHLVKFEMVKREGFGPYEEQANVPTSLFYPPMLVPLLLLAKLLQPKMAYFLSYFLLVSFTYLTTKKLAPGKEEDALLCVLFPLSAMAFFRVGRMLEFMAHLPFIVLLFYLDRGRNTWITTGLVILGATTHLPTAVFYSPILFFKAVEKKLYKSLFAWGAAAVAWAAAYLPKTWGMSVWKLSRADMIYLNAKAVLEGKGLTWLVYLLAIALLGILASLKFLGKEALYATPSMLFAALLPFLYLIDVPLLGYVPGWNQVILTTVIPLFSYLLLRGNEKWWKIGAALTIAALAFPLPWVGEASRNFKYLDTVNGKYTMTAFPPDEMHRYILTQNYLAHRGVPTVLCPTWEYSDPRWYFYHPGGCDELRHDVDYIILPASEMWVKDCGVEYTETPDLLIVKA